MGVRDTHIDVASEVTKPRDTEKGRISGTRGTARTRKVLQHQAKKTPSGNESTSGGSGGTGLREAKGQNGPLSSRRIITSHVILGYGLLECHSEGEHQC